MNIYNRILEVIKSKDQFIQAISNDEDYLKLISFSKKTKLNIEPNYFGVKFQFIKGTQASMKEALANYDLDSKSVLVLNFESEGPKEIDNVMKFISSKSYKDSLTSVYFNISPVTPEIRKINESILSRLEKYQQINDYLLGLDVGTYTSEQVNNSVKTKVFESFNMQVDIFIDKLNDFEYYKRGWYDKFRPDLDSDVFFQRGLVWTLGQKQELIHSMLNSLPIGQLFINKTELDNPLFDELDNVLFDGKQRLTTIAEFFNGEFPIVIDGKEVFINGLSEDSQLRLRTYSILVNETNFDNIDDLIDFYVLINVGQTLHTRDEIMKALAFKTK